MPAASKKTLIYTRVSTDEQAATGFSLRDQEARLREHCARTGSTVVAHFQDDASAKTFERPEFKKMLALIQQAPHEIDEVLVVKWDRFSRDMTGALAMIRELGNMGVEVQAAEQPIDFSIPEQMMMLAIYVASPDVENRRRSLNTITGTRRAMKEGRWCNAAPKGYTFERDDRNKPVLVPNDDAPHIRQAFEMAAHTDLTLNEILLRLRKRGFRYGTSTFFELMRRPIYKGVIEIAVWRDEPAEIVKGIHEPIVSAELWDRVQQVRFEATAPPKPAKARGGVQAAYPLRGQLACPACSTSDAPSVVTASASRGNGGVYAYYHCHHCGGYRARAADVHEAVEGYLRQIQIHPALAALYRELAADMSRETLEGREADRTRARDEVEDAEAKLLRADEMFFEGTLEADSYHRLKAKLKDTKDRARQSFELAEAGGGEASVTPDDIRNAAELMESLPLAWSRAMRLGDVEAVHDLIGSIAPGKIAVEGSTVRTIGPSAKSGLMALKNQNADPEEGPASGLVAGARFELTIFGL